MNRGEANFTNRSQLTVGLSTISSVRLRIGALTWLEPPRALLSPLPPRATCKAPTMQLDLSHWPKSGARRLNQPMS